MDIIHARHVLLVAILRLTSALKALTHEVESGTLQGAEIAATAHLALWALRCAELAFLEDGPRDLGLLMWRHVAEDALVGEIRSAAVADERADMLARKAFGVVQELSIWGTDTIEDTRIAAARKAYTLVEHALA